jgi:DNA-binding transcriptional ArsR family regulator
MGTRLLLGLALDLSIEPSGLTGVSTRSWRVVPYLYALTAICPDLYTHDAMSPPFAVLAEPHRRQILDLLLEAERPVGDLVQATAMSQPAVSKHLRVLRDAGLVDVRPDAQRRIYRVRTDPLRAVDEWLEPYRRLWASRLDALGRHLETMEDETI